MDLLRTFYLLKDEVGSSPDPGTDEPYRGVKKSCRQDKEEPRTARMPK